MRNWLSGSVLFVILTLYGVAFAQQSFYSIHISSLRLQAQADSEVKNLKTRGLDAFARHEKVKGKGMWYRIYVGKYATQKEATGEIKRLQQMKVSKYFAVRELSGEQPKAVAAAQAPVTAKKRPEAAKPVSYYLFVGFYRDLDPARKEVNRLNTTLAPDDYRAFLTGEKVPDGMNYRVYIGTFADRQQAAASGAGLKDKKILTSFYIPVPTTQDMISGRIPDTGAGKAAAAAAATAAAAEETKKAAGQSRDEKPAPAKTTTTAGFEDFSRFALMFKGGGFSPQKVDTFTVTSGSTTYRVSDDAAPQVGIEAAVRFNKVIGLYASADTVFIDGIDWYNFAAGPLVTFQAGESVMPYFKGGAVYGNFSWDAPGEFDSAFGWEAGAGIQFLRSSFKFGLEFSYRSLSFDYTAPPAVIAPESSLDMSGYALMATLSYWF